MRQKYFCLVLSAFLAASHIVHCQTDDKSYYLTVSNHDITLAVNESKSVMLQLIGQLDENVNVTFIEQHDDLTEITPSWIYIKKSEISQDPANIDLINFKGINPGHLEVTARTVPNITSIGKDVFVRITVANSWPIYYISIVFGWIYFAAWSISFYPQIITNFKRKSVVGLNFDFLSLNIVGFILYSTFNVGLFWIPEIQNEYANRYPRGLNPVLINDIFFSLHAVVATFLTIYQCFVYDRAEQRVSFTARGILGIFSLIILVSLILVGVSVIVWLDFLYICSYIKLSITLIKYIPQAVMNFRRKSTVGWSIGNILLDFIGGTLSMLQMILNAYNYDDWASIFGDPTKFGLGLFSVCFDIFFILQHYVFYRNNEPYEEIPGNSSNNIGHEQETSDVETAPPDGPTEAS